MLVLKFKTANLQHGTTNAVSVLRNMCGHLPTIKLITVNAFPLTIMKIAMLVMLMAVNFVRKVMF